MRGIVIACPQKYESICLANIVKLRTTHNCHLPVEIWEIGEEVSPAVRTEMQKQTLVTFKNVNDYCIHPEHWKGFQIKAFALYNSAFEESILCDADVTFYKSPEIVFSDEHYIRTGTYFFRDLDQWQFYNLSEWGWDKFQSLSFFNSRKRFVRGLLPEKSGFFPAEWSYIYDDDIPGAPVKEALQESGVVYMDKTRHAGSLKQIFYLNDDHATTYQYVWGDKETFWLGCLMAGKEFYLNHTAGVMEDGRLTHHYRGDAFWRQK
jgi:hypothetical protein